MITIRKLSELPVSTRLRKSARILHDAGAALNLSGTVNFIYLRDLASLLLKDNLPAELVSGLRELSVLSGKGSYREMGRFCDSLHFQILNYTGTSPADWDFREPEGELDPAGRTIFPFRVYLDDLRSPFNVGSIFRTAESFGIEKIFLSPATPGPEHPRAARASMGCTGIVPWERENLDILKEDDSVFALELGGTDISEFSFPESGTVILGSEELGLSTAGEQLSRRSLGRVSIPLYGVKGSINVSVAFGILMYNWCRGTSGQRASARSISG